MVMKTTLLLLATVAFATLISAAPIPPTYLLVEYMPSPFYGVDIQSPRFSWTDQTSSNDKAVSQYAYQIVVATDPLVSSGIVWDSGTVVSNESSLVSYGGPALKSDTSYYWKVRWWDENKQPSAYSNVAQFDTALYTTADWQGAQWIGGYNQVRKEFNVPNTVVRARAYVSGAGYYELYLNGAKVGDYSLDISWTDYKKRVMYTTYDVTSQLKVGQNAVGIMIGNGWWGQGLNGAKMATFLLSVQTTQSAQKFYVVSNNSWSGENGPITADSIYNGETYDATKETPGWNSPGYNQKWNTPTVYNGGPGGALRSTMIHPVKVMQQFNAQKITQPQKDVYVYDFGQNFSGWCKLKVKGPRGTVVRLRHAEILQHDGSGMIYTDNLRSAKATDYYTLKGDPNGEVYEPRFTYHGFRFAELTGFPGTPSLDTLTGYHVYSSLPSTGTLNFTNTPVLHRIQHNIIMGQQCNFMSVPTDCDQRDERLGWMGDAQLSAEEAFHNFDVGSFYSHFVRLINDDEGTDGTVTDTVPYIRYGARPADPAWGAAYPLLVYWLHQYNGDLGIVKEQYNGVKGWIDYLANQAKGSGIGNLFFHYGDWVPPPPAQRCNESLTSAFYFLLNTQQLALFATKLGNTADAQKYNQLYQEYVPKFNEAFFNKNTNSYAQGYQTCNSLPLFLAIQPNNNVITSLLNDVAAHGNHLTTGIIGTKYLPLALSLHGRTDVALVVASQVTYPSWGYMFTQTIEAPATTLWELWDSPNEGPGMNSRNHIMFGSISAWFYQYLIGIQQQPGTVGFTHSKISPPDANVLLLSPLSSASGSIQTPYGQLSVSWSRSGGMQCKQVLSNYAMEINCGARGGVIKQLSIEKSCRSTNSIEGSCYDSSTFAELQQQCIGQQRCNASGLYGTLLSSDCSYDLDQVYVVASCSAAPSLEVAATIPVNTVANIHVNKLNLVSPTIISEGTVVWQNGQIALTEGVTSATDSESEVVFSVGSGSYNFQVSGTAGEVVCSSARVNEEFRLECPENSNISLIKFASYGTPSENCNIHSEGEIHAGSSVHVVEGQCLHKNSCRFNVDSQLFGLEMYNNHLLTVAAYCS